jgi:hypothetical protein
MEAAWGAVEQVRSEIAASARSSAPRAASMAKVAMPAATSRGAGIQIPSTLRDLEVQAKSDQAAIDRLQRAAREPLRRWLKDGEIKVGRAQHRGL